jgi:hypothetical protein
MAGKGSMVGKMPGSEKVVNGLFVYRLVIGQGGFPFPPFLKFCFPGFRILSEGQIGHIGLFNEGLTPIFFADPYRGTRHVHPPNQKATVIYTILWQIIIQIFLFGHEAHPLDRINSVERSVSGSEPGMRFSKAKN